MRKEHAGGGPKRRAFCKICSLVFKSRKELKQHQIDDHEGLVKLEDEGGIKEEVSGKFIFDI